jgi:hypothetical protein
MKTMILGIIFLTISSGFATAGIDDGSSWVEPHFYMVNNGMRQMNWGYNVSPFGQGQTTADDGNGFFNSDNSGYEYPWFFESRMRPGLTFHGSEVVTGHLQMELNSAWGRESSVGTMQYGTGYLGKLRFRQYWVETILGQRTERPITLKLGRQSFSTMHGVVVGVPMMEGISIKGLLPDSWGNLWLGSAIVDTRGNLDVKNSFHSLRFKPVPQGRFTTNFYGSYLHINDDADPDENRYKDPLSYTKSPRLTNGSWIMGRGANDLPTGGVADVFWLGAQSDGAMGPFFVSAHAVANFASFAQNDTSQSSFTTGTGYFFQGSLTYDTGVFGIGPSFIFTSGHNGDRETESYDGFLGMAPDVGFTRMFFDGAPIYNVYGHNDPSVTGSGLVAVKLNTFYRVGADTRLNGTLAFLGSHKTRPQMADPGRGLVYAPEAEGAGKYYGTELNVWLDWAPLAGVNFTAEFDMLLPGSYYEGNDNNGFGTELDAACRFLLSSQVSF